MLFAFDDNHHVSSYYKKIFAGISNLQKDKSISMFEISLLAAATNPRRMERMRRALTQQQDV